MERKEGEGKRKRGEQGATARRLMVQKGWVTKTSGLYMEKPLEQEVGIEGCWENLEVSSALMY